MESFFSENEWLKIITTFIALTGALVILIEFGYSLIKRYKFSSPNFGILWTKFRIFRKLRILFLPFLLISIGILLLQTQFRVSAFIGSFLITIGIQIWLWTIGIRLELLGTADSDIDTVNDNKLSKDNKSSVNF